MSSKELILQAIQYYLDSVQRFLTPNEMAKIKKNIENACREEGLLP